MSDSTPINIRQAVSDDVPAIVGLDRQSSRLAHWTPQEYVRVVGSKASHVVFVAELEYRTIVGFLAARMVGDDWDLENIVVAEDHLRTGIASRLLSTFIDLARGQRAKSVLLEVRSSNFPALALYRKFGFQQDGSRKSYYSHPVEDALLFSLSLKNSS